MVWAGWWEGPWISGGALGMGDAHTDSAVALPMAAKKGQAMSGEAQRHEEMLEQFRLWRDLSSNTAGSAGEIVTVALTSGMCLAVATVCVTWFAWGRPDLTLALLLFSIPLIVAGLGSLVITTRLVGWKVNWWTMWIQDQANGREEPAENIRLIRLKERAEIEGVDTEDLRFFVRTIWQTHDWSQRGWRKTEMPSGRPCTDSYHREMIEVLCKAQVLRDYGPRQGGYLSGSVEQALEALGLT